MLMLTPVIINQFSLGGYEQNGISYNLFYRLNQYANHQLHFSFCCYLLHIKENRATHWIPSKNIEILTRFGERADFHPITKV